MADLVVTLTIPDAARADFLDAYAARYGWVDVLTSGTKAAFARGVVRDMVRAPLRDWRRDRAVIAALAALPDDGISTT